MNIINDAYAQTPQSGGGMSMLIMIGIFFVIMYFMIIRPQNKRAKEHNKLIDSLTNGTEVVVSNGIMGKIVGIKDDTIDLEISKGINIKVRKNFSIYSSSKRINLIFNMKIFSFKQIMVIFVMLFSITYSLPTFFNEVPNWLTSINAKKMNLGLDLKGGVHF